VAHVLKPWFPSLAPLGGDRDLKRWGLVGGLQVTGGGTSKGIVGPWSHPLSSFLLPGHEVNSFVLPYTSVMVCPLTTGPKQQGQSIKE
jgi:hypothetical protein